jgi:transposase-like protein
LLSKIPSPKFVVCDGKCGMINAIKEIWCTTVIQRCQFHVKLNARQKLTLKPKTDAGKELLKLVNDIFGVNTIEKKEM